MTAGRPAPVTVAFAHRGHNWIRGSEQCLLDLVARLDPARFRPVVICEQPVLAREAAAVGVPVERLDPADDWGVLRPRAVRERVRARLHDVLRAHDVALVHANMTAVIPAVLPAVRRLRVPLVAHLHLPVTDEYCRLHEFVHQADVSVGVAEHVVEPLRADGVRPERLRVIYNGIDATRLAEGDASGLRAALGIPPAAFVAVSVGSLIHRKAHDNTLRAVAVARARGTDVRLLVCGDGEEAAGLEALAKELGVTPFVHFLGYRSDIGAVVRDAADVFVSSAREETLGLNVLEAQSLGVPVIASDIPAHHESLPPGGSGVLVPSDDPDALAQAVLDLASAPERRAALAAAGPRVVAERFSMDRYVGAFEALYAELLAHPRRQYGWVRGVYWPPIYTRWAERIVRRQLRLGAAPQPAVAEPRTA